MTQTIQFTEAETRDVQLEVEFPIYMKDPEVNRIIYFIDANKCIVVNNYKYPGASVEEHRTNIMLPMVYKEYQQATPQEFKSALRTAVHKFEAMTSINLQIA
jgi:hypothetical protein